MSSLAFMMISSICIGQGGQAYQIDSSVSYSIPHYLSQKIEDTIVIDGLLDDPIWQQIAWTTDFVDIEGIDHRVPNHRTRAKICWNSDYIYIAAELQEDHIWATLTKRDDKIYLDNAFEVFIDSDGDGHNYMELQINAYNTIWDLYMRQPYGIDGSANAISGWQANGLQHAVHVNGTINNPSDVDTSWTVELAIPQSVFGDFSSWGTFNNLWRINLCRVDWPLDIINNAYARPPIDHDYPKVGNFSAWSPTGEYNTHRPDRFGYVAMGFDLSGQFKLSADEYIKTALWDLYYQVRDCLATQDADSCSLSTMTIPLVDIAEYEFDPQLAYNTVGYDLYATSSNGQDVIIINEKRLLQLERIKNIRR